MLEEYSDKVKVEPGALAHPNEKLIGTILASVDGKKYRFAKADIWIIPAVWNLFFCNGQMFRLTHSVATIIETINQNEQIVKVLVWVGEIIKTIKVRVNKFIIERDFIEV